VYLPFIIVALLAAAAATVLTVIGPDKLKDLTDEVMKAVLPLSIADGSLAVIRGVDMEAVKVIALTLLAFYVTAAGLNLLRQLTFAVVTARVTKKMRTDLSNKINKLPLKYYDKTQIGDVISRVTNDVDAIGQTLGQGLGESVSALFMVFGSMFMMFYTNVILAVITIVSTLVGFALMVIIMKVSQKYFTAQQKGLGEINGHIEEIYSGHTVVKAYNGGADAKRVFEEINGELYVTNWKSQFLSGLLMPIMAFSGSLGYVAVCVVGALLAQSGMITFGVIVAFTIYMRLFVNPLNQFAQSMQGLQRAAAAGERIFGFFDEAEMEDEGGKTARLTDTKGGIELRNVRFGYTPDKTVINDFSAKVEPGQKIAIVGPTGAGKTTIVNLLMRFYELDGGEILMDGIPAASVPRNDVHDRFAMVLQDTWLFEGTIKENVIYSKQGVTDAEVVDACKAAGLHHFIRTLPNGYDTVLNETNSLSAGQKQMLTIARAIIQNSPLLILDEATSSVDTRTEVLIQRAMDKLTEGRTSFVIAHRLSTVKNADLILVMDGGDVVESGTHDGLLAKGEFYSELYNNQFA
jgi:ATP-binding cassette subfamily B protein